MIAAGKARSARRPVGEAITQSASNAGHAAERRGFALIVVLWFLVLLAALGTYLLGHVRSETAVARNTLAAARAEAVADAAIAQAVFNLTDPVTAKHWAFDGAAHVVSLPGGDVSIRLHDEAEKINPNLAPPALVAALFVEVGVDQGRATRLAAAIRAWIGPPDPTRPDADIEPYRDSGLDYGPPHAPFESLDDLSLVIGMTPEIFAASRPYFTIFSKVPRPDGKNAAPAVVKALALAPAGAADAAAPPPVPNAAIAPAASAPAAAATPQTMVEIDAVARSSDGGIYVRDAVVRLDPANPRGYVVLDWRRGALADPDESAAAGEPD